MGSGLTEIVFQTIFITFSVANLLSDRWESRVDCLIYEDHRSVTLNFSFVHRVIFVAVLHVGHFLLMLVNCCSNE